MRLATEECRWFHEGDPPDEVERWFHSAGPEVEARVEDWRVDFYVAIRDADEVGIKWRASGSADSGGEPGSAAFEVKGRTASLGLHRFGAERHGHVEQWTRWRLDEIPRALGLPRPGAAGVIEVRKRRLLRVFRLDVHGSPALQRGSDADADGAVKLEAELGRLELGPSREAHWTICFEASPTGPALHGAFDLALGEFLADAPESLRCTARGSCGYPAWLRRQAQGVEGVRG